MRDRTSGQGGVSDYFPAGTDNVCPGSPGDPVRQRPAPQPGVEEWLSGIELGVSRVARCSSVPGRFALEEPPQFWIIPGRTVEHGGELPEFAVGEAEVAPVEQYRFRFPASRIEHEIRAASAEGFGGAVDQKLLALAGSEIGSAPDAAFQTG
jgi:hypothetical protein